MAVRFVRRASSRLGSKYFSTGSDSHSIDHLLQGFPIEVRESRFGRGAFATQDIPVGQLVLREEPYVTMDVDRWDSVSQSERHIAAFLAVDHKLYEAMQLLSLVKGVPRPLLGVALMLEAANDPVLPDQAPSSLWPICHLAPHEAQPWSSDQWTEALVDNPQNSMGCLTLSECYEVATEGFGLAQQAWWGKHEFENLWRKLVGNWFGQGSLYVAASMFNHACPPSPSAPNQQGLGPNVAWDANDSLQSVISTRDILSGEELFLCYDNEPDPIKRVLNLANSFDFFCACAGCRSQVEGGRFRGKKVPRNQRCSCGSGKKYKNCCGDLTAVYKMQQELRKPSK